MDRAEDVLGPALAMISSDGSTGSSGAGVLIAGRHILTCAHVVNSYLRHDQHDAERPASDKTVSLTFPFVSADHQIDAHVVIWAPLRPDGGGDLAVLELRSPAPQKSREAKFFKTPDLHRHEFWCYGFPEGYSGRQASGRLLRAEPNGLVAMEDIKSTGARIEAGFSGAPVWDEDLGGIVALVTREDREAEARRAFCMPTRMIERLLSSEWPPFQDVVSVSNKRSSGTDLDKVYRKVWYTHFAPELTAKSLAGVREATGDLFIGRDHIWYEPLDLLIFGDDILRVRFSKAGSDFVNFWVQIEFRSSKGRDVAHFCSGRFLGWGGIAGISRSMFKEIAALKDGGRT